ncbi:hypothetical protein FNL55_15785 [Tardiphaga sp. vice352]|uniref:hypothetical protein n=1 Tax=Tardiphaga sp. vice352 TaxID=2592816 RepID=UPI001164F5B7|nr:hypothetical protein [Tardiphaga sp. vice352]QDM32648.1 hypothetical protein FNL55_15785 [Tardiphaga sp. vice352]
MGGKSSQTTDSSSSQNGLTSMLSNRSDNQIGTTSATKNPWENAMPTINGILGQLNPLIANSGLNSAQQSGIDQLKSNAANGNQFAGQIGGVASNLLSGGGATGQAGNIAGTLDDLKARLGSYANGLQIGNNPGLKAQLDQAGSDTANNINGSFAAAGRDFSGYNQNAVARGVTAAQAPIIANQYNQDVANQISAAGTLYGAGNTTAGMQSGLTQQGLQISRPASRRPVPQTTPTTTAPIR